MGPCDPPRVFAIGDLRNQDLVYAVHTIDGASGGVVVVDVEQHPELGCRGSDDRGDGDQEQKRENNANDTARGHR
jgi:hypothetical protein